MKTILCINYSQSGQLDDILTQFISPLENVDIDRVKISPKNPYGFPWKTNNFYDPMPETVLEEVIELEEFELRDTYDLIIFGYQPWFLSPSLPSTSLLKSEKFIACIKNTPVISVAGARNMWLNAHESVVNLITKNDGQMVGHIALVDRAPNLLSAISIVHWMMTGKKTRKWGIFPLPGISEEDINGMKRFGNILNDALVDFNLSGLQEKFISSGGLTINTSILFIEGRAKKIFRIWARLIKKKEAQGKNRKAWISLFRFYLNFALFVVATPLLIVYTLLFRPFTQKRIRQKKQHYSYLGIKG